VDPVGDEGPRVDMGLRDIMDCVSAVCSMQGQSLPGKVFYSFLTLDIAHQQMNLAAWKLQFLNFLAWQAHEKFICNTALIQHRFIRICFPRSRLCYIFQRGLE